MRPNLNKFLTNHESNQEETTFIPDENNKDKGVEKSAPNLFIDNHKKEGKISVLDALRSSNVQGVKDTGETKFMDIEQYTKYTQREDKGVSPFAFSSNYELSRALNQSNWEQTGHVAAKVLPNAILEFAGMIGNVADYEDWRNGEENGEVGNWLNNWAQERKQEVNKALPIYRESPGKAMDIGDYAWWMENGSALVESALPFVALGFVTGGASLAALTRGAKALEWLSKGISQASTTKKVIQGGAGLTNMMALNQAEGIGIATNVFNESLKKETTRIQQENPELSAEEVNNMAKDIAAKNAAKTLSFNRVNMLLNITSSFAFLRTPALARQIRTSPALSNTLKRMGYEGLQESGEELVNLAAENYGMDGESRKFEDAFRDTFTSKGLESAFLGFIGGAAQTGLTSIGKELKMNKRPDGSRYSQNDVLRERALEQEEAKQRWEGLSQEDKLSSTSDLFMTAKQLTELKNELDKIDVLIEATREKGDNELIGKLQLKAQDIAKNTFNSKAYHAFSTGTTSQLEDFYKGVMTLTPEEAEAKELPENYKEKAQEGLNKIKSLEKEFNKANNYLDSANIYSNRASLLDLRSQEEANKTALTEAEQELELDIADAGIDIDTIRNEDGNLNFSKLSQENQAIVADLDSYGEVLGIINLIYDNKKKKERLTKEYANLISDTYQKQFREDLKAKRQTKKKETSKAKTEKKKEDTAKKTKAKKETIKKQTAPVSNSTGKTTPKSKPPVEEDSGDKFTLDATDEFSTKLVEFTNRTDLKPETIVDRLTKMLNEEKDEATIDVLTSALDHVQNKYGIKPAQPDVQKDNVDSQIDDFATFLEDNSPLVQEKDLSPKEDVVRQKIDKVINLMQSLGQRGVNTQNFSEVAKYLQDVLGKERFVPLFNDIKDVYNLSKIAPKRIEDSYEDIFLTAEEKSNILGNSQVVQDASLPEGFYNYDNNEINELTRQARIEILKDQGYTVYKSDTLKFEGLRTIEGHNKLAHLDKKYSTNLNVANAGRFNVLSFIHTKEDISNTLDGSTDEALLDFDQLNVGSRITLVPVDKVIYDDGTIVYADGRVEKNGEITQQDANEIAPIGIKLDGVLLNKVFLHTTEWINAENIAEPDDVKNQKNKLYEIRRRVLEAGDKGITTTITKRTNGFPLVNADGEQGTISERLPNVEIGIVKDGSVYIGENKKVDVANKYPLFEGISVAVLPVNKGVKMAMPVGRVELNEKREYIDSMLQAVRLYLGNNVNDERAIQLFDQANIDITTEEGLREYLSKFIYIPTGLDFEFDKFASYLEDQSESVSLVRVVGKNIEFGRGAGINKGARFLNRRVLANLEPGERNRTIEAAMKALDNTLSHNMSVNISKNKMNKNFILPLITETEVTTREMPYNDFVKDHLTTDMYSHTLSNGKEIYTIQANIEFDDKFAFENENKVSEEASIEALGVNQDIDEIFNENPQLSEIGSKEDYSNYLKTIFPDSQLKRIVYHGTRANFEDFNTKTARIIEYTNEDGTKGTRESVGAYGKGAYFTPIKSVAQSYTSEEKSNSKGEKDILKRVLLNIKNPFTAISIEKNTKSSQEAYIQEGFDGVYGYFDRVQLENLPLEIVVFEPDQIHTLGSNKDIQGFKAYKNNTKSTIAPIQVTHKDKTLKLDFDEDFSPLTLTNQQIQEFEDTTPSSLLVPGVPIKTQTALIDYLSAEIIKERTKEPITDLKALLGVALEAYNNKLAEGLPVEIHNKVKKGAEILEAVIGNYNKLTSLVEENLHTYSNLQYTGTSFTPVEQNTEISEDENDDNDTTQELEENERNRWSSESIFTEDAKSKASTEVKLALSHVEDIERFEIQDGKRVPVTKTSVFGLPSYILFDEIINEVSGILAFNNYDSNDKITQPTLDSMLNTLEDWVDTKPYLHNVIEKIKEMPTTTQNQFVGVMSKHYTHHNLVYKSAKGNYYINNSDSNNIASVVQNSWLQNLINSDLILPSDTTYVLDGEALKAINVKVTELITTIKSGDNKRAIKLATEVLNDIGIDFSKETVTSLVNRPVDYGKGVQSLLHLFNGSDGAIALYLKRLNDIVGLDIQEHHPFKDNSSLSGFAKEMAKRNPVYFSNSFKDVRGRTYYSYSANKFFTDRFRRLKTDKQLLENLAAQPFSANSYWLNMMRTNADNFFRYFKYYTFDGRKEANVKGKKLSQMSPAEHEESKVALFFSQNKKTGKNDNYIVNVFYPTTSDKGLQPTLSTLGHKISQNLNPRTGTLTNNGINWLYNVLVQPEINRMLAFYANPSKYATKGYVDGARTFTMFPHLNSVEGVFIKEGGSMVINPAIETDEDIKLTLKTALKKHIESLVADKELTWEQYGFIETIEEDDWDANGKQFTRVERKLSILKGASDAGVHNAAYNYVVNYLVANTNIMQTIITDPANYFKSSRYKEVVDRMVKAGELETAQGITREDVLGYYAEQDFIAEHEDLFDNMGKRLAGDIAPGSDPAFEEGSTFNVAHINDEESKSYTSEYTERLVGDGYKKVNSTDAQEYTTLKEHLTVMVAEGKIDEKKKKEILKLENEGKFISAKDIEIILQPMKPVYVNNVFRNGVEHRTYIKSSSFPLIAQLTRGLEIDKLRKAMLRDKIDRVAFDSAIKVGGTTTAETVFSSEEKGKVLDTIDLTKSTLTLPRTGFKIQQEVPYKEGDTSNDGTQQRKLLTSAVRGVTGFRLPNSDSPYTGEQIQAELDKTYNRIYQIQYNKLVEEIDYDEENNTVNLAKIQKVLQEEGLKRNYPLYDLEGFKLDATGNDFIVPLWMNSSSTKVESMLNSIVDNRIRKFKPKGRSYVLGSSTGFRPTIIEGDEAADYIKNKAGIVFDKSWAERGDGQLLNARVIDGVFYPAEIMIAPRFKDNKGRLIDINKLTDSYGYIDLTKVDSSLLELFGFRIPTQGLNSMSYIKVVGFLPQTSGDLLLGPADWTIQMGSDFDVDKLYTNSYNTLYNEGTGAITKYEGDDELKGLENHLLDIHLSILGNPAKEVQAQVLKPLDFGNLGKLAEEIYPLVEDRTPGRGMSEEYQKFKYLNALSGKIGVGVFSNDSTFNALAQGKGLMLMTGPVMEKRPFVFSLAGKYSNAISEPNTNDTKGKTKAEVIAAYQSLAVDNEKEQGMHKLNINSYTFDAIRTLVTGGYEEDVISYFLNQPIIRDYVRLQTLADDNSTSYTVADMNEELADKYALPEEGQSYYLSMEILKAGIKGNSETAWRHQQTALSLFKTLTEHGKVVQSVQSAINTDSAGLGKDLFYAFEKENQVLGLPEKGSILNADRLIGDYTSLPIFDAGNITIPFDKTTVDKLIAKGYIAITPINTGGELSSHINFIRPTTINGFTSVRALMFNNNLWKRFFPYNNSRLNLAFEDIKTITNQTEGRLAQNAELNQELFRDAKSFIIAKLVGTYTDGDLVSERERLLVDTKENISLGNILNTVILNGYNNPFLSRLSVDANKQILPTTVQYQASATENINERALYAAFSNMFLDDSTVLGTFNDIVYTPRKLAQDLVTTQLISGGVQMANQYIKYIPMNYLHSIGFYDAVKKLNFYNEADFNQDIYTNQHIQHKPEKVVLKRKKAFEEAGMIISEDKNIVTYNPVDQSSIKLPRIFSVKNSNRVKGYDLYFKSEEELAGQWVRVSTLGYKDVTEYNPFNENAKSIVPDNNANDIPTPPDLPTNDEELKDFNKLTDKSNTEGTEVFNKKAETVAAQYQLRQDDTFANKIATILDKIIENNYNPFNTLMAEEIYKNLNVIEDFTFILTNTINAEASHSMKDKTIKVNLNAITTDKKFEDVILEELIHALTKPAIVANSTGAVNRLNGLRKMAIEAVGKKLGLNMAKEFENVAKKLQEGTPLLPYEYNTVYPLMNDTEFVGRLFKSKQLQEILNETPSNEDGKSVLQKFWDTIVELLNNIGLDIKKGSALEYATVDIISLINQGAPSSDIQGEIKKANPVYRTKEWIEAKFKLRNEDGGDNILENAKEVAEFINTNYEGVIAWVDFGGVVLVEYKYGDLLGDNLSPLQRKADNVPLFRSYQDRIRTIERNINKAKAKDDFAKVEQLTSALDALTARYQEAVKIGSKERLAQIAIKGKQDMQEVAEFFERDMTVEDTLYIRKILHFWETATDTLFDESERESEKLVNLFGEIETSARYYSDKLVKIESDYMEGFMKKYGKATTIENVFAYFQDINYLQEKTMDISRVDNDLLNAVFLGFKNANIEATDEMKELTAGLDELEERVVKTLKSKGYKGDELFDLFRQRTDSYNLTGHIVSRHSREFTKPYNRLKRNVEKNRDFVSYTDYMEWARNNTKALKLGYLFPTGKFTKTEQVKVDAYKEQLKQELGATHYNEFMEAQAKGIESYNKYKENFIERLRIDNNFNSLQDVLNDPIASKRLAFWKKANSPYEYYRQLNGTTDQALKEHRYFGSVTYITPIPSKPDGYDKFFKVIEGDATLYEFYNYYMKLDRILKGFMSDTDRTKLAFEGIPFVEKTLLAAYNEKGMKAGLAPIWDELKKATRVNHESPNASTNIDPVTGVIEKFSSVNLARSNKEAYDNYVFNKSIEYTAKTGEDPTQGMLEGWHEEIVHELAQKKSYDLPKILRIYSMMVVAYKHKSKIEDYAKLAQSTLNLQREAERTNTGEPKRFENGNIQYKPLGESFIRTKKQLEYFMDTVYGGANKAEGITNKKSFTSEEKKSIKELEEKLALIEEAHNTERISTTEYITVKKKLENQIDEIGGYAAWSKRGDMLLKYIQLKGMGWNVMSAIANIGFGTIANVIEGEGGQLYTAKQLRKAYRLTMGSVGRNATFNHKSPGQSLKIRNMMERWDILKTSTNELYENPFTVALSKRHKWLSPYNLTERTEYINQAPLMIAMAMNTPVELDNGEKSNLWEVMNEEGNLKDGVKVDKATINKLRIKIDQVIKRNHGNYDPNSPLALKKNIAGRALGQFRTWMLEGYAVRFEGLKHDAALGIDVKGRYRSAFDYFTEDFSSTKVLDFLRGMAKFQTLGRAFKSTDFEQYANGEFKDVDVANMRRMVAEVVILIDIYIAYMLLAMIAGELDDEEDNIAVFALNSMLNQGLRLRTDITFYTSPTQFKSMLRDPIPALSIMSDVGEWGDSVYRLVQGDDTIKSGVNANNSRSLRETLQIMPLGTQFYRVYNYGSQQFSKD